VVGADPTTAGPLHGGTADRVEVIGLGIDAILVAWAGESAQNGHDATLKVGEVPLFRLA
jgi:hypothetical protein